VGEGAVRREAPGEDLRDVLDRMLRGVVSVETTGTDRAVLDAIDLTEERVVATSVDLWEPPGDDAPAGTPQAA
jgi:hypothetical protein